LEFFGLRAAPFSQIIDPEFFYVSKSHRLALNKLRHGVESRKGFLLLSGEAGTGKTLLLRCLMQELDKAKIAYSSLLNSRVTVEEFFEWITVDMDLPSATRRKADVWIALVERLSARPTALLVDDAHKLSAEVLEELELLGNLENRNGNLIQVVMAGNAMLDETLDEYRHHGLKQRVVVRTRISPLSLEETGAFIATRLHAAGWAGSALFADAVVERIWQRTGGVPRLVNLLCESVMETAFSEGQLDLTTDLVDQTD
jgi:general secretion pathway protein A